MLQTQRNLEAKLRQEIDERLLKLEEEMKNLSHREEALETTPIEICNGPPKEDLTFQQQLVELQQEKLQLRKDLQEAVAKRKSAEATTEK